MTFDISNYNIILIFFSLMMSVLGLFILFKKNIELLVDPFVIHLVWLGSHIAFLIGYIYKYGFEIFSFYFLMLIFIYIFFLKIFFKNKRIQPMNFIYESNRKHIIICFYIILIIWLISQTNKFLYISSCNNIFEMMNYRFLSLQGRSIIYRILEIGTVFYLNYTAFVIMHFFKGFHKRVATMYLFFYLTLMLLLGGRSTLIALIFDYGFFVIYNIAFFKKKILLINSLCLIMIIIGLLALITVTSSFTGQFNVVLGIKEVLNRLIANPDGIEYYLKFDGYNNISHGFFDYFMSVCGVYLKQVVHLEYKNVGWQLIELAYGHSLEFAQGPNYTIFMQIQVLGLGYTILYIVIATYFYSRLRYQKMNSTSYLGVLWSVGLANLTFNLAIDLEYSILVFISMSIILFFIVNPVLRIFGGK